MTIGYAETPEGRYVGTASQERFIQELYERHRATRSAFSRDRKNGEFTGTSSTNWVSATSVAVASNQELVRLKRIQFRVLVPKFASTGSGTIGGLRIPDGLAASGGVAFQDPAYLRPVNWLANSDHATYWDYYLPAVNLAAGGVFTVLMQGDTPASGVKFPYVARWIESREIGG